MNNYEAYVYKITVKNGKIYIGYHVGHEQDPYVHSSTDEQMKIDMKEHDFNYEIIDRGTKQNMANLEHKFAMFCFVPLSIIQNKTWQI